MLSTPLRAITTDAHFTTVLCIKLALEPRVPCAQNENIALTTLHRRKQPPHSKRENTSLQLIRFRKRCHDTVRFGLVLLRFSDRRKQPQHSKRKNTSLQLIRFRKRCHDTVRFGLVLLRFSDRRKQPQHSKRENTSLQLIRFKKGCHLTVRFGHADTNKLRDICHNNKFFMLTMMSLMFRPSYRACLGRHGKWDQDNGCTFHACKEGDRGFQVPGLEGQTSCRFFYPESMYQLPF